MKMLGGITANSLARTYDLLSPWLQKKGIKFIILDPTIENLKSKEWRRRIKKRHLIFVPSYMDLKKAINLLNKSRAIVLVFDCPLALHEIEQIEFIDIDKRNDLSYVFKLIPLNLPNLKQRIVQSLQSSKNIKIDLRKFDALPDLIQQRQSSFLTLFNSFIYAWTNHSNRVQVTTYLLEFIFSKISQKELEKKLSKYGQLSDNGLAKRNFKKVIDYLSSSKGKRLKQALIAVNQSKKPKAKKDSSILAVPYAKIAQKFGVEKFELKVLSLRYRRTARVKMGTRTINQIADEIRHRIRKVGGGSV